MIQLEQVMQFAWDEKKATLNEKKHRVSFHEAATVYADPLAITFPDPDHSVGEFRFLTFGLSAWGRMLVVSHADTRQLTRIISARLMTRKEKKIYEKG